VESGSRRAIVQLYDCRATRSSFTGDDDDDDDKHPSGLIDFPRGEDTNDTIVGVVVIL
jgi:hypothetical protein